MGPIEFRSWCTSTIVPGAICARLEERSPPEMDMEY